jgi:DNA-binding MarR family transcriptional regulator
VNLFRKALPTRSDGDVGENVGEIMLTGTQMEIVQRIEADDRISAKNIPEVLSLSVRATEKNIKELRYKGILVRHPEYDIDVKLCAFTATEMREAEHEYEAFKQAN